eukprot:6445035-Lingulodinium_polyedra.AAC.1
MADRRRAPNAVFLVAEEDFRLTKERLQDIFAARTRAAPLQGQEAAGTAVEQPRPERKEEA